MKYFFQIIMVLLAFVCAFGPGTGYVWLCMADGQSVTDGIRLVFFLMGIVGLVGGLTLMIVTFDKS